MKWEWSLNSTPSPTGNYYLHSANESFIKLAGEKIFCMWPTEQVFVFLVCWFYSVSQKLHLLSDPSVTDLSTEKKGQRKDLTAAYP